MSDWLDADVVEVAQRLLGCELEVSTGEEALRVRIVETEAYHQADVASHSYRGQTARTSVMFGAAGYLYVYFTYGMHYCMNIVTGPQGEGSAVLIRAVEPLQGWEVLRRNRPAVADGQLTNGPAKLCQALGIDHSWNGENLVTGRMRLLERPTLPTEDIVQTTRVGISQAKDKLWRFYVRDNPFVSKR